MAGLGGGAFSIGQAGNIAMHVASPIKMPTTHYNGRVGGGGGGGGGGGKGSKAVQAVTMEVVGVMVVSVGTPINIVMAMAVQAMWEAAAVLVEGEMDITTTMLMVYGKELIITPILEASGAGGSQGASGQVEQRKEAQVVREAKEEDLNKVEIMEIQVILAVQERVSMVVVA